MAIKKNKAPYGSWKSTFQPSEVSKQVRLQDVQWDNTSQTLVWLEERSERGVLVVRNLNSAGQRDLTRELSVRARVGYGGGDFVIHRGLVFFVSEGVIYRQLIDDSHPEVVVPRMGEVASPTISPDGRWMAFVRSHDRVDTLEITSTSGVGEPVTVAEGNDFYMQPCWHPSGETLAWIAWDHPDMPWDKSLLSVADLQHRGNEIEATSKRTPEKEPEASYFQPQFSPDGRYLSVVSDETGWPNLLILSAATLEPVARATEEAEHSLAAWIQGLRTCTWSPDSSAVYFLRSKEGFTQLRRFDLVEKSIEPVEGEIEAFTALRQISISPEGDRIAVIGSASHIPTSILSVHNERKVELYRCSLPRQSEDMYSKAEPVHWATEDDTCHGLYSAPTNPAYEHSGPPPAIIKIHGGPTSQYYADYSSDTQFFTSRGYAVLAVNYRGSTGYGKDYRNALKGNWGVSDVKDVRSAAEFLIQRDLADPERIVLAGGSAGGYCLLMCFVRYPGSFGAGICRYGVSDLKTLTEDTHKFEEHYLDSLVGPLPEDEHVYLERSPISHANKIQDPLAIFQGDADMVVPKAQSDLIVASLRERSIPHFYRVYPGEGHGWRKSETIEDYYEAVDRFLRKHILC